MTTYKIIRFYRNGSKRIIKRGLTFAEAQAHCRNPKTHSLNWFDGYEPD